MFTRHMGSVIALAVLLVGLGSSSALAEELGRMRVQTVDGRWLVGEVEVTAEGYRVVMGRGIAVTLPRSQVRSMVAVEEGEVAAPGDAEGTSQRRRITDPEIEALVAGVDFDALGIQSAAELPAELPVNEESLEEMKFLAGADKVLTTANFMMVHTGTDAEARRLLNRLEAVWRWNIAYMKILGLPILVPDYKMEVYFFGTQQEFETHCINAYGHPSGALGYFLPTSNRSHFFDLATLPNIAAALRAAEDPRMPPPQRLRTRTAAERWVEHMNMEVTQHEIGHHLHFNLGVFPPEAFLNPESREGVPRWLVEGTTMMFEVPPSSEGASLGVINHYQLSKFLQWYGQQKFTPQWLKNFVVDGSVFLRMGGHSYPIGWALTYYLRKQFPKEFADYMRVVSTRNPGDEVTVTMLEKEFEDRFGRISEEWIDKWYAWLHALPLNPAVLPPEPP